MATAALHPISTGLMTCKVNGQKVCLSVEASTIQLNGWPRELALMSHKTGQTVTVRKAEIDRDDEMEVMGVWYRGHGHGHEVELLVVND